MKSLLLGVLLVGCSGGTSGGPIAIDQFGNEVAKVACSKIFECCNSAEVMQQFMNLTYNNQPVTTEAQCEGLYMGLLDGYAIPDYKASIAAGRVTYDADAARGCIDAYANLGCGAYSQLTHATGISCSTPYLIPHVGDGGACSQAYECTSGYCSSGTCMTEPPLVPNGGSCTSGEQCASGYCGSGSCADPAPVCDGP